MSLDKYKIEEPELSRIALHLRLYQVSMEGRAVWFKLRDGDVAIGYPLIEPPWVRTTHFLLRGENNYYRIPLDRVVDLQDPHVRLREGMKVAP